MAESPSAPRVVSAVMVFPSRATSRATSVTAASSVSGRLTMSASVSITSCAIDCGDAAPPSVFHARTVRSPSPSPSPSPATPASSTAPPRTTSTAAFVPAAATSTTAIAAAIDQCRRARAMRVQSAAPTSSAIASTGRNAMSCATTGRRSALTACGQESSRAIGAATTTVSVNPSRRPRRPRPSSGDPYRAHASSSSGTPSASPLPPPSLADEGRENLTVGTR